MLPVFTFSQVQHHCSAHKIKAGLATAAHNQKTSASSATNFSNRYDLRFVHLDLALENNTKYISGNVKSIGVVTTPPLDTFVVLLHQVMTVDSVYFNGQNLPVIREDSMVKVGLTSPLPAGSTFTAQVWYKGTPPSGGAAIGSGFSNAQEWDYGQGVTWSLSQPFVAYHWWPCKQELTDKIDSSWVFVTTDSANMAGSNGTLENITDLGTKKRYEWKSRTPIDYYLISVAVSKYKEYNFYAKPKYLNDSILVQNFVYAPALNDNAWHTWEKPQLNRVADQIEFFSEVFGMYPFHREKYGHCTVPIGGGMEHQTMTSQGFFFLFWLNAHELAHQWWGNNVTCKSWGDIWINEGFASYSEHLANEFLDPQNFATHLNKAHNSVKGLLGGSVHFGGADTLNTGRIFNSTLTYDKGGAIIHTLRFETNNDSLFFGALRGFQNTYKNSTASAEDFKNYYHNFTGIDPTQFFDQWYYGEGFPIFDVSYDFDNNNVYMRVTQTTTKPSVTPLFITPVEYLFKRTGKPDTTIILMHDEAVEHYTVNIGAPLVVIRVDQDHNWLINSLIGPKRDLNTGIAELSNINYYGSIQVGPNPGTGEFVVYNPHKLEGSFAVRDLHGREIVAGELNEQNQIDIGREASGIYFISLYNAQGLLQKTEKLVKCGL